MGKDKQTEERILEAAQRVFVRHGFAGARTQDIADEAGVNRALINYYFRSRDNLAEAVFLRTAGTLFPKLLETMSGTLALEAKIQQVVDLEFDMLEQNPYLPLYLLAELQYHPDQLRSMLQKRLPIGAMREAVLKTLQAQLDAEAKAGRIRPILAQDLLIMLLSLIIFPFAASGMIEIMLGFPPADQQVMNARRRTELTGFIMRGIAPESPLQPTSES